MAAKMFQSCSKIYFWVERRSFSSVNNLTKQDYYKIRAHIKNTRPDNWEEAKPFRAVPGPKPLPVIGNTWRFLPFGTYHGIPLKELHQRFRDDYGDIVHISGIVGIDPIIFLYSAEDIEIVVRNEGVWPIRDGLQSFKYYRSVVRKDVFSDLGGLTALEGEDWFRLRSTINPVLMQPRVVELYVDSINKVADDFLDRIRRLASKNAHGEMPEDFMNELNKWSLESVGCIAFDKRLGCFDPNLAADAEVQMMINSVKEMFDCMYHLDTMPTIWKHVTTPELRKLTRILDFLTFTIKKIIDETAIKIASDIRNRPEHENSVLERLIKKDKKVAIAMVIDLIIAGIDTTSKTLGSALYFLAKYPHVQEKLRNEIINILPNKDSPVENKLLENATYLKAVIKETTRMAPIAVGNLRTSTKDLVLCGYQIPKGTKILMSNMVISNSSEHFLKPEQFVPERWLRATKDEWSFKNTNQFVFLPFGFGPRSCVGKRLANMELQVAVSKIIRNFELSWPHEDAEFESKMLFGIKSPLKFNIKEVAT